MVGPGSATKSQPRTNTSTTSTQSELQITIGSMKFTQTIDLSEHANVKITEEYAARAQAEINSMKDEISRSGMTIIGYENEAGDKLLSGKEIAKMLEAYVAKLETPGNVSYKEAVEKYLILNAYWAAKLAPGAEDVERLRLINYSSELFSADDQGAYKDKTLEERLTMNYRLSLGLYYGTNGGERREASWKQSSSPVKQVLDNAYALITDPDTIPVGLNSLLTRIDDNAWETIGSYTPRATVQSDDNKKPQSNNDKTDNTILPPTPPTPFDSTSNPPSRPQGKVTKDPTVEDIFKGSLAGSLQELVDKEAMEDAISKRQKIAAPEFKDISLDKITEAQKNALMEVLNLDDQKQLNKKEIILQADKNKNNKITQITLKVNSDTLDLSPLFDKDAFPDLASIEIHASARLDSIPTFGENAVQEGLTSMILLYSDAGKGDSKLTTLPIKREDIEQLVKQVPNLEMLSIENANLREFPQELVDALKLKKLNHLDLSNNLIEKLPDDILNVFTEKNYVLDISNNHLTELPKTLFEHGDFSELTLYANGNKKLKLDPEQLFQLSLNKLKLIDLSNTDKNQTVTGANAYFKNGSADLMRLLSNRSNVNVNKLQEAMNSLDLEAFEKIINNNIVDVNHTNAVGESLLVQLFHDLPKVSTKDKLETWKKMVTNLLENGNIRDVKDKNGMNTLAHLVSIRPANAESIIAARELMPKVIKNLGGINNKDNLNKRPISYALENNNTWAVKFLLDKDNHAQVRFRDKNKDAPLTLACGLNINKVARTIQLKAGEQDTPDNRHIAAVNEIAMIVERIYKQGKVGSYEPQRMGSKIHSIKIDGPNKDGVKPLTNALKQGNAEVVKFLLENGAKFERYEKTKDGLSDITAFVESDVQPRPNETRDILDRFYNDKTYVGRYELEALVNVEAKTTLLMQAVRHNKADVVTWLLEKGSLKKGAINARINERDISGETAYVMAEKGAMRTQNAREVLSKSDKVEKSIQNKK